MALSNRYLTIERVDKKEGSPSRWLSRLWTVLGLNWLFWIGLGCFLGGSAIGTMPSHDGFVFSNRIPMQGGGHAVSEQLWVFSLFHDGATLLLTPLAAIASNIWRPSFVAKKSWKKWLILAAIMTFCFGWYAALVPDFYRSLNDWRHYKPNPELLERATPQPAHEP